MFVFSAVGAAAVTGGVLSVVGQLLQAWHMPLSGVLPIAGASVCALYGCAELAGRRWQVPTSHWLIPRRWAAYGTPRWELMFGAVLGIGILTIVPFVGFYILLLECLRAGAPALGMTLMATFGLCRCADVVVLALIRGDRSSTVRSANLLIENLAEGRAAAGLRGCALLIIAGEMAQSLLHGLVPLG